MTTPQAAGSHLLPGDEVWLHEHDYFLTRTQVKVLKICKGGNVLVKDGDHTRQTHIRNLRANAEVSDGV